MPENKAAPAGGSKRVSEVRAAHIAEAKRKRRAALYAVLLLFLTFYIAISLVLGLWIYFSFNSASSGVAYAVRTVRYGANNRETAIATVKADRANIGGGLYIPAGELDKLCGFSFAGDKEKLTILLSGGEYMECFAGSSLVVINGTRLRLSLPVLYVDGTFCLPVELAEEYMTGLSVDYSEKEKLCRISLPGGDPSSIGFRFKPAVSPSSIPAPALE